MDEKPETHDYPYVLVSAAHCNYICKDRIRGDVQETCCCRPPDREGSCAPNAKPPVKSFTYIQLFKFNVSHV